MKKALIITYYWPPAGGPGVQRWLKFTKYLSSFGVEPFVLTVNPEKATYPLQDESLVNEIGEGMHVFHTDTFEPFGAYKKATGRGEVPFSGFANETDKPGPRQKLAKFVRGNFFLPDARKGWNKFAIKKAEEIIKKHAIKTIITTSPPHSTQLIGLELKKKLGVTWLADLRDPWTDIYYYNELYPTALAKKIDRKMELDVLRTADFVSTVSDDMKRLFVDKSTEIIPEKIHVLPNGFDEADFVHWPEAKTETFTIVYGGTLTHKYNVNRFLTVLDKLAQNDMNVKLVFAGKQDEIVSKTLDGLKSIRVEKLGYLPHGESLKMLNQANALFLGIPDLPDNKGILTGKLFEYLAAKRPILNIGPTDGDAARIIEEANAGTTLAYDDAKGMEAAILKYHEAWKNKSTIKFNDGFVESFSRKALTKELVKIIS